jgi:hypothetical protein
MQRTRRIITSVATVCALALTPLAWTATAAGSAPTAAAGECRPGKVRVAYGSPSKSATLADSGGIYKVSKGSSITVKYTKTDEDIKRNFVRKTWDVNGDLSISPKAATKLFVDVEARIGGSYKSDVWEYNSTLKISTISTKATFNDPGRWLLYRGFRTWKVKWSKLQCNRSGMAERLIASGVVTANQRYELSNAKCSSRGNNLVKAAQASVGC